MLKKIISLIAVALILVSTLVVNGQTALAKANGGHDFKTPNTTEEKMAKDKIDKVVAKFKQEVDKDIEDTFMINLSDYKKIDHKAILTTNSSSSLKKIFISIMLNQQTGDIIPSIYFQGNKGFIIEKKADGTNVVYTIHNNSDQWEISKKEQRTGRHIPPPQP